MVELLLVKRKAALYVADQVSGHTLYLHTHSVSTAIFPGEPGLAGCPLNSPFPFILLIIIINSSLFMDIYGWQLCVFIVLIMLVWHQAGHLACKKGCWFVDGDNFTGGLQVFFLLLSPPLPSSLAAMKPANPGSHGKVAVKMERERDCSSCRIICNTWQCACTA